MTTFLLPCTCSAELAVTAGQAGGTVTCARCGRTHPVPKLRELERLRRRDDGGRPAVAWRPAQAVALLGAITAATACVAGFMIAPPTVMAIDEDAVRQTARTVDDVLVYKTWINELAGARVQRPALEVELLVQRQTRFAEGLRRLFHIVAALAAGAAGVAGVLLWSGPRSASRHRSAPGKAGPAR